MTALFTDSDYSHHRCDNCGATAERRAEAARGSLPDQWSRASGLDLCAFCACKARALGCVTTADLFANSYQGPSPGHLEVAAIYYRECELYDRTVCTGCDAQGMAMPLTPIELRQCNTNAIAKRKHGIAKLKLGRKFFDSLCRYYALSPAGLREMKELYATNPKLVKTP